MEGVTVVTHPLVQHKLTLLRDKNCSTKSFRELCKEIGVLLCYEVTRDLPLTDVEIETPLIRMSSPQIAGKKLVFAPILRAGMTFVDMLDLVPAARVAHIGLYRDPNTFVAIEYFFKAPSDLAERLVIVVSPVLATGNTATAAIDRIKERGPKDIRFVCLIAAQEGVERCVGLIPMFTFRLPPSTIDSMSGRSLSRVWEMPAIVLTARDKRMPVCLWLRHCLRLLMLASGEFINWTTR